MKWILSISLLMLSVSSNAVISIAYINSPSPPRILGTGEAIPDEPGASVELVKKIGDEIGVEVDFIRAPWARGIGMLKAGIIDGIFHASFNTDRDKFSVYPKVNGELDLSKRMFDQAYHLFKAKNTTVNWDGQAFSGLTHKGIGVTIGYSVIKDLEKLGVKLVKTRQPENDFRKLAVGRLDGLVTLNFIGQNHLANPKFSNIEMVSEPIVSKPYYLIFSKQFYKDNAKQAQSIWDKIQKYRDDGTYDALVMKYLKISQ